MTIYDLVFEKIQEMYENGEYTIEEAEALNDLAYDRYVNESTAAQRYMLKKSGGNHEQMTRDAVNNLQHTERKLLFHGIPSGGDPKRKIWSDIYLNDKALQLGGGKLASEYKNRIDDENEEYKKHKENGDIIKAIEDRRRINKYKNDYTETIAYGKNLKKDEGALLDEIPRKRIKK